MGRLAELEKLVGLSLKTILVTMIGLLVFGIYLGTLLNGENSLTVLKALKEKKVSLRLQSKMLKMENQKLQKEFFELKQLEPSV